MVASNRARRNVAVGLGGGMLVLLLYNSLASPNVMFRLSMSTAYTAIALLTIALVIGPLNIVKNKRNPVSSYLRRDMGLWAGFFSVLHVIVGLQVHLGGRFWLYFVYPGAEKHLIPFRHDPFGIANYAGLVATLIIAMLMIISNDVSVRSLGIKRWKRCQQLAYVAALLAVTHGALYQAIERRSLIFVGLLAILVIVAAGLQFAGYRKRQLKRV